MFLIAFHSRIKHWKLMTFNTCNVQYKLLHVVGFHFNTFDTIIGKIRILEIIHIKETLMLGFLFVFLANPTSSFHYQGHPPILSLFFDCKVLRTLWLLTYTSTPRCLRITHQTELKTPTVTESQHLWWYHTPVQRGMSSNRCFKKRTPLREYIIFIVAWRWSSKP